MASQWVDVSDIHLRDIRFQVTRADGRVFEFSDLVTEMTWADHVNSAGAEVGIAASGVLADILKIGGEGSSCRVTAPLVDLDTGDLVRRELWQGTFEEVIDYRNVGQMERYITGYDIARFFTSNEEDYVFTNHTLSGILTQLASDFGIPTGVITATSEKLGQIISRGLSMWDLLAEAIQRHADRTGEVFRIYAERGRIQMREQGDQDRWWVFESGESLQEARRTRSTTSMVNRVKIYGVFEGDTTKPVVEATRENTTSQELYGLRQRIEYLSSADDEKRVVEIAEKTLDRFSAPEEELEITGWLVPNLRAGERIRFIDSEWGLNRLYYVESIESVWSTERAQSVAMVRREAVDPELILAEVTVA